MTTFTLQDLTPEQQVAVNKHEEMHKMFQQMGGDLTGGKTNVFDAPATQPTVTKEKWMEYGMNNPLSASAMNEETLTQMGKDLASHEIAHQQAQQARLDAVPPQPTQMGEVLPNPDLITINNICTQLHQLLTTIINQSKAQPNTTPPEGNQSLQECVSLTLQQADWFKDLIRHELVALDIAEIAKDAVEDIVENEVESYFEHNFDPENHFDFVDAVGDAVDDRLDDVVREKLDDVVQEQLEEVVAEKLGSANLTITF
jgi:hypothetical protein